MKIFLIIIGCIFLYIFVAFITFVLYLYYERCEFGASMAYDVDMDGSIVISLVWPLTIWFALGYLLYSNLAIAKANNAKAPILKKYAIAITEVLYQINHKETKNE